MPITRDFTPAELADLGVPPDSPEDVEWSDTVLSDTHVTVLKYTQQRRAVFIADDDLTYAVEYESPVDAGDYETGPAPDDHGWYGDTVTATRVVSWPVITRQWQTYDPDVHEVRVNSAFEELTTIYEEGGCRTPDARQWAVELLTKHAAELAAQQRAHLVSEGYGLDCVCEGCSVCLAREYIDLIDPAAGSRVQPDPDTRPFVLDAVGRHVRDGDTVGGTTSGRYQATITGPVVKLGKDRVKLRVDGPGGDGAYRPATGDETWISTARMFLVAPRS